MSAASEESRMSVESYFALEAANPQTRYEYLDGRVLMMSGGSTEHGLISGNVITLLNQGLRDVSCMVFTSDVRVMLNDSRYVYPDVSVVCAEPLPRQSQTVTAPTVVVEVLSPGTEAYDRGVKLESYRACPSLQAVLLIAQDRPAVDVYIRRSVDIWMVQTYHLDDEIILDCIGV